MKLREAEGFRKAAWLKIAKHDEISVQKSVLQNTVMSFPRERGIINEINDIGKKVRMPGRNLRVLERKKGRSG